MANKAIYICDRCKSYTDVSDIYKLSVNGFRNHQQIVHSSLNQYRAGQKDREICFTCMEQLIEQLQLNKQDAELVKECFDNFKLPEKHTDDDVPF